MVCPYFDGAPSSIDPDQLREVVRKGTLYATPKFCLKIFDKRSFYFAYIAASERVAIHNRFSDRRMRRFRSPARSPYVAVAKHRSNQERYVRLARIVGSDEDSHRHDLDTAASYGPKVLYVDPSCICIRLPSNFSAHGPMSEARLKKSIFAFVGLASTCR